MNLLTLTQENYQEIFDQIIDLKISEEEINQTNLEWLKQLPLSEYLPKPMENPFGNN